MAELVNSVDSFEFDGLIGGTDPKLFTRNVTIVSGAGVLPRGRVLGKIKLGAITAEAKTGGNTGNGTIADLALGISVKAGVYKVICITAATDGGVFSVIDPEGVRLDDATVGTAYVGPVCFKIADGTTDFVAGDGFDVTVAAGSGKFTSVDSTNLNGSQVADCVLAYPVDATLADVVATVYVKGCFNREKLTCGGTDTADKHEDNLREVGILLTSQK